MAKTEVKKVSRIRSKNKTWYKILAPKAFGQKEMGETYLGRPEEALGRKLKINLKELTGDIRDQNVYLKFLMDKIEGTTVRTSLIGYQMTPAVIKRLVRKGADRVDDYFITHTRSGQPVVVKTLLITLRKAQKSVKTKLRKLTQEVLKEEVKKGDLDFFVTNLINANIRNLLKKKLNKVYPLREAAIRILFYKKTAGENEERPEPEKKPAEEKSAEEKAETATAETTEQVS